MTLFQMPMAFCLVWLFIVGSVIGSVLNVCVYRIPTKKKLWESLKATVHPPSHCPRCGKGIPGRFNIPIIGWLSLKGRCFHCRRWISLRYPIVEFANGGLFAFVYWMEIPAGFTATLADSSAQGMYGPVVEAGAGLSATSMLLHCRYLYHMVMIEALFVASLIDLDHRIIPDGSTLPAMLFGLLGALIFGDVYLTPVWHENPDVTSRLQFVLPESLHGLFMGQPLPDWIETWPHLHGLAVSAAGLIIGGAVVGVIRLAGYWALRQEAMGFGDVVLIAMIGSFLGWQAAIISFFLAPMMALLVVALTFVFRRDRIIPFGPYLSLAALVTAVFWKEIWSRTEVIFGSGPLLFAVGLVMAVLFALVMRLVRITFEALGIATYGEDEWIEEWTSADHLFHFSGETVDPRHGRWRTDQWPGGDAGRGWSQYDSWRNG